MMDLPKDTPFADKLRRLRRARRWSQKKLGERCQKSRQQITRWETNILVPDVPSLVRLCVILDWDIAEAALLIEEQERK